MSIAPIACQACIQTWFGDGNEFCHMKPLAEVVGVGHRHS
jgi:hypothetical protein